MLLVDCSSSVIERKIVIACMEVDGSCNKSRWKYMEASMVIDEST